MSKLISLIIPVYNVEQYIEPCLASFVHQLDDDIEVIIVNDGSSDQSMQLIIDHLLSLSTEKQACFKILEQSNQGQSVARNVALAIAQGEYIAFLDADDVLAENYFAWLRANIAEHHADIIQFKSYRFHSDPSEQIEFAVGANLSGLHATTDALKQHVFNQSAWFPWLNIYKKSLFDDGIEFPVGVYYEDAAIIPQLFLKAESVLFLSDVLYGYRYNPTGSLMSPSAENIEKHLKSFQYVIDVYKKSLQDDAIFSPSLVSMSQGYVSYVFKHRGWKQACVSYKTLELKQQNIQLSLLEKRGNILFYKYGMAFLLLARLMGKI